MTNKEAINMLKSKLDGHTDTSYEWVKTVRMAIKALEQKSCKSDVKRWKKRYLDLEQRISKLEKQQPCEDIISRTELLSRIDAERKHLLDIKMDGAEHVIVHHARRIIEDMPSVTPQRSKGKWIQTKDECEGTNFYNFSFECSECRREYSFKYKYCPWCGAKMEVEE